MICCICVGLEVYIGQQHSCNRFCIHTIGFLFPILFLVVLGIILYTIIGNISTWNKNNHSPRLTVPATVVAKRTEVSRHHTDNTMMHTFTTYYVTFQVESGDRMELTVSGSDSGMLVEGDIGKLSFQGTRYLGFERN